MTPRALLAVLLALTTTSCSSAAPADQSVPSGTSSSSSSATTPAPNVASAAGAGLATVAALAPSQQTVIAELATTAGIEEVEPQEPVDADKPDPGAAPGLPPEVVAFLDVVDPAESKSFTGEATVVDIEGDVVELELPDGLLRLMARTRGSPFPVQQSDDVTLAYLRSDDPFAPHHEIVMSHGNDALGAWLLSGSSPLGATAQLIPGTTLRLDQDGNPSTGAGLMRVRVSINAQEVLVAPFTMAEVGAWSVIIIDSRGPGGRPIEGPPYGLRAVVWRTEPP